MIAWGKHFPYCNLAKANKHIVKELLERTYLLVRWLLRLFYQRSKSSYRPSIYFFTWLNFSCALHPKSYRLLGFRALFINTEGYQHYGATVKFYVYDDNTLFAMPSNYVDPGKLFDDIAYKLNGFVVNGWTHGKCNIQN